MACATVIEEMLPLLPPGMEHRVFDFGLHVDPARLRAALQETIDAAAGQYGTILLGYGMCSQALIGIRANECTLVVPRVDDCIAIFLGSSAAYAAQVRSEPGTYYLTKGWIEVGDTPFSDYEHTVQRYGKERADAIYRMMMGKYKRLALIDTGAYDLERYRNYARETAQKFNLTFEEIQGSDTLLRKMLAGDWDEDFIVLRPGERCTLEQFLPILLGKSHGES